MRQCDNDVIIAQRSVSKMYVSQVVCLRVKHDLPDLWSSCPLLMIYHESANQARVVEIIRFDNVSTLSKAQLAKFVLQSEELV